MDKLRTVLVELKGKMPLLMHADNIEWADQMEEWKNDPDNKGKSKAGDDRTPAYRWMGCLNYDDPETGHVTIPAEYIMRCLMAGGASVPVGKGKKTFKEQSQSGIISAEFHWCFFIRGKRIPMLEIRKLTDLTFKEQEEAVRDLGFRLFVKRVGLQGKKHIRVRPQFHNWTASGELMIIDEMITDKVLQSILDIAGRLKGLGDWRPSAPHCPGPFGTFEATIVSK